jgi:uncharacterized protein YndB with AHSA1/START domain
MTAELARHDGRFELRFERTLAHPPERVWAALTSGDDLAHWFPATIHGDWRPGAPLRFVFEHGEGPTLGGEVRAVDPPRLLEFTWNDEVLRFELAPAGDGGCRLRFVNRFDDGGKAARDGAGWHDCLDRLAARLDGHEPPTLDWRRRYAVYVAAYGPEHATAPLPD